MNVDGIGTGKAISMRGTINEAMEDSRATAKRLPIDSGGAPFRGTPQSRSLSYRLVWAQGDSVWGSSRCGWAGRGKGRGGGSVTRTLWRNMVASLKFDLFQQKICQTRGGGRAWAVARSRFGFGFL